MKNAYVLLLTLSLMTVACSEKKSGGGDGGGTPTAVVPPPVAGSVTPPAPFTSGATATLNINMSAYEAYTGRVANNPSDFKVNIDLHSVGTPSAAWGAGTGTAYAGTIKVTYQELSSSGQPLYYQGSFTSGSTLSEARYNQYTNSGNYFKAMFEDSMGGVILVVDSVDEFDHWSGRVFFKNFQCGRTAWDPPCNSKPPRRCWLVSAGPYDCTAFKTGGTKKDPADNKYIIWNVNTSSRTYPEDYIELGTFGGVDSSKALNN